MMKIATSLLVLAAGGAHAFAPPSAKPSTTTTTTTTTLSMSSESSKSAGITALETLAPKLNPIVPFWDPLGLTNIDFYGMGQDASVGFLRHAEIKHGRVAMAAFVGYCVQSNWHWPWAMMRDGTSFPSIDLSPEAQWDAVPTTAKWQIYTVIAALELWDEASGGANYTGEQQMVHYVSMKNQTLYILFAPK